MGPFREPLKRRAKRITCHEVELCEDLPNSHRFYTKIVLTGKNS